MLEGFASRFEGEKTDRALGIKRKGRYRSYATYFKETGPFGVFDLTINLLRTLIGKTKFGDNISEVDAANMRANLMEIWILIGVVGIGAILKAAMDDEDDDKKASIFMANILINQMTRMQTDIMFYTSPTEFENLTKNALPVFGLVNDAARNGS